MAESEDQIISGHSREFVPKEKF